MITARKKWATDRMKNAVLEIVGSKLEGWGVQHK